MPKVHFVKKARKDNPAVKAGESYYWWKFRFGPKRYSRTKPRRSQLTQSEFLSELYELEDHLQDEYTEDDATSLAEESLQFLAQLLGKEGPEESKCAVDRGRVDMLIVRLADIRNTQAAINSQLVELGQKIG